MSDLLPSDTPDSASPYVALPVYEFRIGQQVQSALIDARWLPMLRELKLHYWFIGDKRPGQPMLRRSIGAVDQYGKRMTKNFVLQRVIATAVRLKKIPPTLQELYDHMLSTPAVRVDRLLAPNGMFDFRNDNIVESNRQGGRRAALTVHRSEVAVEEPTDFIAPVPTDDELRRHALESLGMSEDQFALLAKPGDDIDTLKARREAESESLIDQIFGGIDKGTPQENPDGHE